MVKIMNCKLHVKQLLNIHPNHEHTYLDLYAIAYGMPNKAQYLERMAAAMAAELDDRKLCDDNPLYVAEAPSLDRPGDWVRVSGPVPFILTGHRASTPQQSLMKYDPATGDLKPYPSHAEQYRKWHGSVAWLFNPWAGTKRDPRDIGSDVRGAGIKEPASD